MNPKQPDTNNKPEEELREESVRQIVIETNGSYIKVVKNETSNLEFFAILQQLLNRVTTKN